MLRTGSKKGNAADNIRKGRAPVNSEQEDSEKAHADSLRARQNRLDGVLQGLDDQRGEPVRGDTPEGHPEISEDHVRVDADRRAIVLLYLGVYFRPHVAGLQVKYEKAPDFWSEVNCQEP